MDKFFLDKDLSNAKDGPSDNSAIANGNEEDDKTTSEVPDSSQQKSLSFHEDPQLNVTVSPEVQEEIDVFEDTTSTPNISNAENTVQPKGILRFDKTPAPHISEINNFKKINLDKINEMDKFRTMIPLRVYGPYQLPSPDFQKAVKDAVPGPSNFLPKKKKRAKKPFNTTDYDDDANAYEDVKSITNCLIKNTLNILIVDEASGSGRDRVIEFNTQVEEQERQDNKTEDVDDVRCVPMETDDNDVDIAKDDTKKEDNTEEGNSSLVSDNEILETPHCSKQRSADDHSVENVQTTIADPDTIENEEDADTLTTQRDEEMLEVARASREALVDPNSEQSLLEDFEVPDPMEQAGPAFNQPSLPSPLLMKRIEPAIIDETVDTHGFPLWLLQMLGAHVTIEEPHYFCQGDGLGVHPSVIVEVEDEDDTTDSSNNTAEFEDVEQGPSVLDVSSLSVDAGTSTSEEATTNEREFNTQNQPLDTIYSSGSSHNSESTNSSESIHNSEAGKSSESFPSASKESK